jgi:hypothetical protein
MVSRYASALIGLQACYEAEDGRVGSEMVLVGLVASEVALRIASDSRHSTKPRFYPVAEHELFNSADQIPRQGS